ncbi:MAG: hypothetical protein AB7O52_12220 [Planctomycetota bacterium]
MTDRRAPFLRSLALWVAASAVMPLGAQPDPSRPAPNPAPTPAELVAAVERSTDIILGLQESLTESTEHEEPGREWPYEGVYRVGGKIPVGYRVGGTAICAWALTEAPTRREAVDRALERANEFIFQGLAQELMRPTFSGTYDVRGWGHIYALTYLLRARQLGRMPPHQEPRATAAIRFCIEALEQTELTGSGGWNYSRPRGPESPASTFMTAPAVQALIHAARLGERVNPGVVDRAVRTLEMARLDTGAFQYSSNPTRQTGRGFESIPGAIGRMPGCEVCLFQLGKGSVERVRGAVDAFFEHWQALEDRRQKTGTHEPPYYVAPYYFFFAHYYAAQAIEVLPEDERADRRARLYALLFKVREDDGGWNDRVFPRSMSFGTAMALLAMRQPSIGAPEAALGGRRIESF